MNTKGFSTILNRQFKTKFARFLLASLGISVGVWSITMTTSLAQGTKDTIFKAINSQPAAKRMMVNRADGQTNFMMAGNADFMPMSEADAQKMKDEFKNIDAFEPLLQTSFTLKDPNSNLKTCWNTQPPQPIFDENGRITNQEEVDKATKDYLQNCHQVSFAYQLLEKLNSENTGKIIGKNTDLKGNEIIVCFKCGGNKLNEILKVKTPEEMVGKDLELTYESGPQLFKSGEKLKFNNETDFSKKPKTKINTEVKETFKIVGVVDDRESSSLFSNVTGALTGYMDKSYFYKAFELANPGLKSIDYGPITYNVYADSFSNVQKLNDDFKNSGRYTALSPFLEIIKAVNYVFLGLTVVFGIFGLIALFASVFGIINLMIVSVLERQKEIGILKALGSKNSSIFWLFLTEAMLLGIVGWVIGTVTAFLMSHGIFAFANNFINQKSEVKNALLSVGVDRLTPSFPWWMLLTTLAIALFFTTISGLIPAIRAAKQNPADVMRVE